MQSRDCPSSIFTRRECDSARSVVRNTLESVGLTTIWGFRCSQKAGKPSATFGKVPASGRPSVRVLRLRVPRLLLGAQTLSEVGDWAARGALQVLIFERTHSPVWSALVAAASLAPWVGIGQFLAASLERFEKRSVMIFSDVFRGALFSCLVVRTPPWLTIVLLFVAGLATPAFEANRSALLRRNTPDELYPSAISIANVVVQSSLVLGYAAGGWAVATVGATWAIAADAASFGLSALLLVRLPASEPSRLSARQALSEGALLFVRDSILRWTMLLACTAGAMTVAVEAVAAPYVLGHLRLRGGWVGVSLASIPVGTLLASTVVPYGVGARRQLRRASLASLGAAIAALILFTLDRGEPVMLLSFAAAGAMLGCLVPCNAVLGSRIPLEVQGTAFAVAQGVLMAAQGSGALAGGLVAEFVGARGACLTAAGVTASCAVLLALKPPQPSAFRQTLVVRTVSPQ